MSRYIVGIDLAKLHDYTALVILDTALLAVEEKYAVTVAYRYPIGIEYHRIAAHMIEQLLGSPYDGDITLVVDATGLGGPVLEQFRKNLSSVMGVTITAGAKLSRKGNDLNLPKIILISTLLSVIENQSLYFAEGIHDLETLTQELMAFQGHFGESGRIRYEGRRAHDDMVIALALAVWYTAEGRSCREKPNIYTW
jgi:hypothetical protein